ncbi:MAG: WYL domain-containing protein [Vampirovibrionales bacterium]|nr:WYL domain-containing protein [Vampirovibrionales bacterium]
MTSSADQKLKASSLNATAYRIFKLLQWLSEAPLSVEELNARFLEDPVIGRTLSEDSIWLYLNTLRKLGCDIARPVASSGYRYRLRTHPFGARYAPEEIQTLIDAKRFAESHLQYPEILHLDRFFKKVILFSSTPDIPQALEALFHLSRSRDYEAQLDALEALYTALQRNELLFLQYQSPVNGLQRFYFLPEDLFYRGGVMYLSGAKLGAPHLLMLRVDRIEDFETTEQPALYAQLASQRGAKTLIRLHIEADPHLEPPEVEALGGHCQYCADASPPRWEVTLETRDRFAVLQRLFQLARPFKVLEPDDFRQSAHRTLSAMARLYQDDAAKGDAAHGR